MLTTVVITRVICDQFTGIIASSNSPPSFKLHRVLAPHASAAFSQDTGATRGVRPVLQCHGHPPLY